MQSDLVEEFLDSFVNEFSAFSRLALYLVIHEVGWCCLEVDSDIPILRVYSHLPVGNLGFEVNFVEVRDELIDRFFNLIQAYSEVPSEFGVDIEQ